MIGIRNLYVFCGDKLLVAYLKPENVYSAKHIWAILALLVNGLRMAWPIIKWFVMRMPGYAIKASIISVAKIKSTFL